jgi:hypothetical protein
VHAQRLGQLALREPGRDAERHQGLTQPVEVG